MVSKSNERAEPVVRSAAGGTTATLGQGRLDRAAVKKSPGYIARSWRRFRRNKLSMFAMVVFILIVIFSYGAPLLSAFVTHQTYDAQSLLTKFAKPGQTVRALSTTGPSAGKFVVQKHWLGSDELGRAGRVPRAGRAAAHDPVA